MRIPRAFHAATWERLERRLALSSFYAAPSGSAAGDGSVGRPWDLQTALTKPSVMPGDSILLRGGTYEGAFTSNLTGTAQAPIRVQQYPGERAVLDTLSQVSVMREVVSRQHFLGSVDFSLAMGVQAQAMQTGSTPHGAPGSAGGRSRTRWTSTSPRMNGCSVQ